MEFGSGVGGGAKSIQIGNVEYEMTITRGGKEIFLNEEAIEAIKNRILPLVPQQELGDHIVLKASNQNKESFAAIDRLIDSESAREVTVKPNKTPSLLMKFYEFFEKRISPKKYEERHNNYAERLVSESPLKMEKTRDFRIEEGKYAVMPKGIKSSKQERWAELRSPKIGANAAVKKRFHENVETLESGDIKVVPYEILQGETPKKGRVTPTSFVHATEVEEGKRGLLTNIYLGEGKNIMRSGVINTEEKARAFIKAAKTLNPNPTKKPWRIVSNQLNSPEWERKLIKNQHDSLAEVAKEDQSVEIAHFVTPTNRFYHFAKSLGPLNFLWGERKARENNREGLMTYLNWIKSDFPGFFDGVNDLENAYKKLCETNSEDSKLKLFKLFLGNQLQKKEDKMERGQELLVLHLLNQKMGVVSSVNCKSGLDRTGFVFSLMMAVSQTMDDHKQMDLVLNWDKYTKTLNQKMLEFDYSTKNLYEWVNKLESEDEKKLYLAILDFRLKVFENLVRVGMPITATSTGLLGVKWEHGWRQNLVPLNFLPPVIKVEGKNDPVQIINYDKNSEPSGLTKKGERLIVQLTNRREA